MGNPDTSPDRGMTLDEAIRELRNYNSATYEIHFIPFYQALQLGIEVLIYIALLRETDPDKVPPRFYGEKQIK